jgi:extradiol dioxygenase family protein
VAELSGIPLAKVERYEGQVLAERDHVAQQARKVEVASPAPGHDVYRSVFGDSPASLGEMVAHRLTAHGIEAGPLATRYGADGDGPSLYLHDPEGNVVELKGPPDPAFRASGSAAPTAAPRPA